MELQEYQRRVEENTKEYLKQLQDDSFDLMKFHGADVEAGEISRIKLCKKGHDLLGAVMLKFLPYLEENTGADALAYTNNSFREIEIKTTYTDQSKLVRTERNAVYSTKHLSEDVIDRNKTTSLKSCFNASYDIKKNKDSKARDTYLLAVDEETDAIIECAMATEDAMRGYLKGRQESKTGSMDIKLSTLEDIGSPYRNTVTLVIGYNKWKESVIKTAPLKKISSPSRKKVRVAKG